MDRHLVERLKSDIRLLVLMAGDPTFHELIRIPGFGGDEFLLLSERGISILLWPWCSPEAVEAMAELIRDKEVGVITAPISIYHTSCGPLPPFPVLEHFSDCDEPHWLPTFLRAKNIRRPDNAFENLTKTWLSSRVELH